MLSRNRPNNTEGQIIGNSFVSGREQHGVTLSGYGGPPGHQNAKIPTHGKMLLTRLSFHPLSRAREINFSSKVITREYTPADLTAHQRSQRRGWHKVGRVSCARPSRKSFVTRRSPDRCDRYGYRLLNLTN